MAAPSSQLTSTERAKRFLAQQGCGPTGKPEDVYAAAERAVGVLLKDNHKYRERLRSAESGYPYKPDERLQTENNDLRSENERLEGLVPPAGATILTGPDVEVWTKFKALNLAPDKVTEAIKQRDELQARDAQRTRDDAVRQAADDLGFKPSVLVKVAKAEGLHIEFKDVTEKVDGKNVVTRVAHVRPAKDEKADLVPLEQFAENELKDYLPALLADDVEEAGGESDEEVQRPAIRRTTAVAGVEYPVQRKGGGAVRTTPSHEKLVETARASGDYGQL
jgi:hypothetical protein